MKVYKKTKGNKKVGSYLEIKGQKLKILNIKKIKKNVYEFEVEDLKEDISDVNIDGDML